MKATFIIFALICAIVTVGIVLSLPAALVIIGAALIIMLLVGMRFAWSTGDSLEEDDEDFLEIVRKF